MITHMLVLPMEHTHLKQPLNPQPNMVRHKPTCSLLFTYVQQLTIGYI